MSPFSLLEKIRQIFARRTTQTGKTKRTLRLVQLEDRRMLNGAIAAAGIDLTGSETLTISQGGNVDVGGGAPVATVNLTLTNGTWTGIDAGLNGGLYELDGTGKILTVDASVLDDGGFAVGAGNELHIQGDDPNSQHVTIDLTGVTAADSFIPSNGIAFSGGETDGDIDSLSVSGYTEATVNTLTLSHTGQESGTITLSGMGEISYSEIEPLALGGTAANLIINLPAGADLTVRLSDNGVGGDGVSQISGAFELTTFANPTVSLTINDGTGVKAISVRGLDSLFNANVSILEDDAADDNTVTFEVNTTNIGAGTLHVEAGPIALNAQIVTTGNVELLSTASITDGNAGTVNITAATATLNAVNGIGSANAIETNITQLEATNTTAGLIEITEVAAGVDIALGAVNNGTRNVTIRSTAGAITDGNGVTLNITAGTATLNAVNGIGSANAIETSITQLAATNTTAGLIEIAEVAAGVDIALGAVSNVGRDVIIQSLGGSILDGNGAAVNVTARNLTLTAPIGNIGASSADVFKGVFDPIEVSLSGNLTASAPLGAVAVSGPVAGTQTITALTLYIQSAADLDVSATVFTFTNLALLTTGKLTIADTGLAVTGDLRIEANDVDAATAGNPVLLGSGGTRIDRLLYRVTNGADEFVSVFTDQLDVLTRSNIQVHVNGGTQLRDLNCDLTSFNTNGNTGVIVSIGGTITQGTAVGTIPGTELNDKLLSQNLLLLGNGTICLDHPGNDVNTIAGQLVGTSSLFFNDIDDLIVGTVSSLYPVPAPAFPVMAYNGLQTADGDIHVQAGGTLTVNQTVAAGAAGNVLLSTTGNASDLIVNAAVSSGTGNIMLNAGDDIDVNTGITTAGAGAVYLRAINVLASGGADISVIAAITTVNGDILIEAGRNISQSTLISTTNGDVGLIGGGNITQTATGDVTTTNGDVLVDAGGNWTMANGTVVSAGGQDVVGRAGTTITLGQISMTNATANRVALHAVAGDITDANGATVNIEETVVAAATSVSLRAGGMIGAADPGNGTPPVNVNAIDLNVDFMAANAATGIYLREIASGGAITVDQVVGVSVSVDGAQVNFKNQPLAVTVVPRTASLASLEDLRTTTNGPIKLVAESGTVTVNGGSVTLAVGVSASGTGDVLLEARGAASDVIVNAGVSSGTGHITLNADDDIDLNGGLSTGGAGSAYLLAANGTADAADPISIDGAITTGNGDILIQSPGNITQTAVITTTNGDVGLIAVGNLSQTVTGDVTSTNGDVLIDAGGNWTMANGTVIRAGGQDFVGRAGGTITLGQISMTNATANRVALQAVAGDIADANAATVNIEETVAAAATSVSLRASGMIGAADAANGMPLVNINAIDLNVDSVAALAATGIYLREIAAGGAVTVRDVPAVTVTVDGVERVNFNSTRTPVPAVMRTLAALEDLSTTPPGGPIKLVAENGTITVEGGTLTPAVGVVASGAFDILLEARGAAGDVVINASIATGTGHITLSAGRDIDLNATVTTVGSGTVNMRAGRNVAVDAIVTTTDGDILVRATGNITQTDLITTTNGDIGLLTTTGNINQTATGDVTTTNGDVLIDAGGNWTMANGTVITVGGQDFFGRAGGTITLGTISMTNATTNRVGLQAVAGDILDANAAAVNIEETVAAATTSVSLRAGGMIGASDAGNGTPPINNNAIDLKVDRAAALAATGIYLRQIAAGGAIIVRDVAAASVSVAVQQVNFNSTRTAVPVSRSLAGLEDLTTSPSGGPIKLVAENGTITIDGGADAIGISASGAGDVLLEVRGAASDVIVNAGISSGAGHITLNASDDIDQNANISTGGAGTVHLLATNATVGGFNGIDMQSGTSVTTSGGNVRFVADNEGDILLGLVNVGSGDVSLIAERSILDNNAAALNVQADALRMVADAAVSNAANLVGIIGGSDLGNPNPDNNVNAIDTAVTTLAAQSADGIYVRESDGLTVDFTGDITVQQVNFNSTITARTDLSLSDLTTTDSSPIKLQSVTGSLVFNDGDADNQAVSSNGTGDVLLQTLGASGDIIANGRVLSGTGHITLNAGDDIDLNAGLTTGGAGSVFLTSANGTADIPDTIGIDGPITTTNGDILIQTSGSISQTAAISTTNGNVGLIATVNIVQTATGDVTSTNSDVLVDAGGNWTMANGTVISVGGQDFLGRAGGTMTLGTISMTNAAANRVALQAVAGDILDGNAAAVNIEETVAGSVTSLSLRAGGKIGASGGGVPSLNGNAVDLNVDTVAARAATGIYLNEILAGGDLTVDNAAAVTVNVAVQQVNFNSTLTAVPQPRTLGLLEDLTTTADSGEIQVVVQFGRLTVNQGPADTAGVTASGNNSRIHLEAAGDVIINANITAGTPGGVTAVVDNNSPPVQPGEQIVIRSVSGNILVGTANVVTISTDEDLTAGVSSDVTSDRIQLLAGSKSPLSADAPAAQNQITLTSVRGFAVGDVVEVDDGDSGPQVVTITAITGNTLTLNANLTSNYSTAQSGFAKHLNVGSLTFGNDVTLRTDGGVAHQFAARPQIGVANPNSAFMVLEVNPFEAVVNNLRLQNFNEFLNVWKLMIGATGEENLRLNIDWRDPFNNSILSTNDLTMVANGLVTSDRMQVFYLDAGMNKIGHVYTNNDLIAYKTAMVASFRNDFSVSHHDSILVFAGQVTQNGVTEAVSNNQISSTDDIGTPTPIPPAPPGIVITNETDANRDLHFEGGLLKMIIPTVFLPPIIPEPRPLTPLAPLVAAPNPIVAVLVNVAPVEVAETPFSSFSTQSEDYFQLRDGVTGKVIEGYEHIADEFGELLLQPARLKQWVTDEHLQDQTDLELWLITRKQTGNGHVTIERPVLKFDIADGRPFPASEPMPDVFDELKLLPLPLDDNLNDQSSPTLEGSAAPIDGQSPATESEPKDGDNNRPIPDGQSRFVPSDSERGATEADDEPMVTATSPTSRSILTSVAVAAVLNKARVNSIVPSKSRQQLNRILNRQG